MSTVKRILRLSKQVPMAALAAGAVAAMVPRAAHAAQTATPFEISSTDLLATVAQCRALQGAAPDGGVSAPSANSALHTGICLYHLLRNGTDRQGLLDAVSVLESAQTWGLDRSRQAAAMLMEGLSSCRIAQLELQAALPSKQAQSPLFCLARKNALATFSRLRIQELRVTYAQGTTGSINELMSAMAACYSDKDGPLNKKFAAGCGVYQGLDAAGVAAVAARAYGDISNRYLLGASAPITAMFTRKREMAQAGLKNTQSSVTALRADSQRIGGAYTVERGLYDQIATPLDDLVKGYQETYAMVSAVLKQYNAWKLGLFEQKTPVAINYTEPLQSRMADVVSLVTTLQASSDTVDQAIGALKTRAALDATIKKNAQAMCRAFFCELAVNQGAGFSGTSSFTKVCNRMTSPLCPSQGTKLSAGGVQFTPIDFCTAAEFPAKYMVFGMSRATANICWAEAT